MRRDSERTDGGVRPDPEAVDFGSHQDCVITAAELLGEDAGVFVSRKRDDIDLTLDGRFDCYEAALKAVARKVNTPGADPVINFHTLALSIAAKYVDGGIPDEPPPVKAKAHSSSKKPFGQLTPEQLAQLPEG